MTMPADPERSGPRKGSGAYSAGVTDGSLADAMDLRDFLHGVGTVFQLPPPSSKRDPGPAPPSPSNSRSRRTILIAATAAVLLGAYAATRLRSAGDRHLPAAVQGEWTTSDPRYAGRAVRLEDQQLTFIIDGREQQYPVRVVRTKQSGDTMYVAIDYDVSGQAQTWPVAYVATPPALHPLSQRGLVWTRASRPTARRSVP